MYRLNQLQTYLKDKQFSQIFILIDENTGEYCLPLLLEKVDAIADYGATLLEIPAGEESKSFETIKNLSSSLLESNADKHSLLISLGGGVITDIGGFLASIYKRGIQNINIPTTLLSMVDAAIGYKTGINLNGIKNAIGTFNTDTLTFFDTSFLQTLSDKEILSGVGEMLKTFLVADREYLMRFIEKNNVKEIEDEFIFRCVTLKEQIVQDDVLDNGKRKILNFGHTLGHAFESYYSSFSKDKQLSHGEAVAIGMYYALKLSEKKYNIEPEIFQPVYNFLSQYFIIPPLQEVISQIQPLLYNDKKTISNTLHFVLLKDIANPQIDVKVSMEEILSL